MSPFHETHGYYAQGVGVTTAVLPNGWRERLISVESPATEPGRGMCLDPHDCVVAKLVAGRGKDIAFADALIRAEMISVSTLMERVEALPEVHPVALDRIRGLLARYHAHDV